MDVHTLAVVIAGGGALGVLVWLLAKLGKALVTIAETLAAAAVVFLALWLAIKAVLWAFHQTLTHWRTSPTVVALLAWWHWWGWASLATAGVIAGALIGWRLVDLRSFDAWAGRHLRARTSPHWPVSRVARWICGRVWAGRTEYGQDWHIPLARAIP